LQGACTAGEGGTPDGGPTPAPWFVDVTAQWGVDFVHEAAVEGRYWLPESIGSGVAVFDYDNDDDLDLYFINGAWRDSAVTPPVRNQLYRQEAAGRFVNVTAEAGLGDPGYGQGVAVGDYDNDGDRDVYVTNVGRDALYRNNGDGTFTDVTRAAGITNDAWGVSVAFADVDLDGWLDIFVVNYLEFSGGGCADQSGTFQYCPQYRYPGITDVLYRNNGNGTFSDITQFAGIATVAARGLGVTVVDANDDGRPDIFVSNDGEPNHLWANQGDGTFADLAQPLGLAVNAMGVAEASMGIAVGDIGNDGTVDLLLTHIPEETNTLYRARGGSYRDATFQSGIGPPSLPFTGFGTGFLDADHDGDLDLAITNGGVFPSRNAPVNDPPGFWDPYAEPDMLFENAGDGRFQDVSSRAPDFTAPRRVGRGLAFGDLDGDGDIDMVVTDLDAPGRILENRAASGSWLLATAYDPALRREVPGARITATLAGSRTMMRLALPVYSFLVSNDPRAHFGLGDAGAVEAFEVVWPGGQTERFPGSSANREVRLERGAGQPVIR
jgi:hypothetical protein